METNSWVSYLKVLRTMEFSSIVQYQGGQACYRVASEDGKIFKATLLQFEGLGQSPPSCITFYKEDEVYMGDSDSMALIHDLSDKMHPSNPIDEVLEEIKKRREDPGKVDCE
jgi:hypothetical protein